MKFSHTLSLNANPDWADHYCDYAGLKKLINELESSSVVQGLEDEELLQARAQRREVFLQKLTKNMTMVRQFYDQKRAELDLQLTRLRSVLELELEVKNSRLDLTKAAAAAASSSASEADSTPSSATTSSNNTPLSRITRHPPPPPPTTTTTTTTTTSTDIDDPSAYSNEKSPLLKSKKQNKLKSLSCMSLTGLEDNRVEICDLFTQYHNLKLYATLNRTAVRKILKKHDKVLHDNLKDSPQVLDSIKVLLPFGEESGPPEIERSLQILQEYFAHFYCKDNQEEALRRLQLMVRELVSFQRHTIWLDVIEDQRKHESAQIVTIADKDAKTKKAAAGELSLREQIQLFAMTNLGAIISTVLLVTLVWIPIGIFDADPAKRNALALFVFVSLLWATEAFPLFVTSMLVPLLTVMLRVIIIDGHRLDATAASKHAFGAMFSHVIMLLIGGFSIAAALSKHNIVQLIASSIARQCGSGIRTAVAVHLFLATFASMWISNVAAPVLCYSLIAPILKAATAGASRAAFGTAQRISADRDHRLCKALVMGIALASNVGGMASPISSPQNLFAIEYASAGQPIGWLQWFVVSIPLCIGLDIMIWAWLCFCFELPAAESAAVAHAIGGTIHPGGGGVGGGNAHHYHHGGTTSSGGSKSTPHEPFTATQHFVMGVSIGVVLLWCASGSMERVTGQMGLLGIVPFVMFFGTGILPKEDLNNFLWSVVILAMGGLVLGEAVKTSGLLDVIAQNIALFIEDNALSLWSTMCIFTSLILFCTTFVSHTVGAIVVIPIVQAVGSQMQPTSHANELVFAAALACSAAMGLPVSGFPNMTAVSVEDNLGNRFLTTKDFLKYALPASIFSWGVIVTLGYWLILVSVQMGDKSGGYVERDHSSSMLSRGPEI